MSNITAVNDKEGKFTGEIQLQGGGEEVDQASSLIRQQLMGRGSIDGSWACCNAKRTKAKGCDVETNHDSTIQWSFLDRSKVVTTHSLTGEEPGPGKVFALDCEMVETTRGKEVARVTLLDFEGHDCIETPVKPSSTILDYRTAYSGMTEDNLRGVSTTLEDVQNSLVELVSVHDILVGHSIDNDLRCLHFEHRKVKCHLDIYKAACSSLFTPSLHTQFV